MTHTTPISTHNVPANDVMPEKTSTPSQSSKILPLRVESLSVTAKGEHLLQDVSFELSAGPRTVIMGPNGAGKSLLLRLCHGLLEPTSGSVRWMGGKAREATMSQAMVFQRPVLLRRTVAQNVDYGLKLHDVPRADRPQIIQDVLNRTGLARFAEKPARLLSGGEQQKLALARAWALKPDVLFLDEPTASLDPAAAHAIEAIVQTMHDEGTRIIMTTHDIAQAKRLADEVIFVHKGRVLEKTPAEHFFDTPECGEAAAFLRGELRW